MKKPLESAFTTVLLLFAIMSIFPPHKELTDAIVRAIVIPSFLLSLISFVNPIHQQCEYFAGKFAQDWQNFSKNCHEEVMNVLKNNISDADFKKLKCTLNAAIYGAQNSLSYSEARNLFQKCSTFFSNATYVCYILLFLSLMCSSYFSHIFAGINSNCITLISLAIQFVDFEMKENLRQRYFRMIVRYCQKQSKKKDDAG